MNRLFTVLLFAAFGVAVSLGCGEAGTDGNGDEEPVAEEAEIDTLTSEEKETFAVDPTRYREMEGGRLDTVDMVGRSDDAAWHVQVMNYAPGFTAMTYAAWYVGPDSVAWFAADHQPYLEDDLGNRYEGVEVLDNPRIKVESGTTAVGVYVFDERLSARADSLTLHVNDSTAPVIRVGPFGVEHQPADTAGGGKVEMGAGGGR
ncbi:MAG: hypothetical protein R3199_03785 [Gemmatimonadota bacterium]|nr:hypothetical protein [Gemmatimonadota bacterium]